MDTILIEGERMHVSVAAMRCNVPVKQLENRVRKCKCSRLTWQYLKLYGHTWKLPGRKVRMGPTGWEVRYPEYGWIPYAGVGVPPGVDTLNIM